MKEKVKRENLNLSFNALPINDLLLLLLNGVKGLHEQLVWSLAKLA